MTTGATEAAAHARVIDRLRLHAEDVRRLAGGLDETVLATRAVPGKWSLKELVCHVWRVQELFRGRLETMLGEEDPQIVTYAPDGDPAFDRMAAGPASEPLSRFSRDREELVQRLEGLSAAQWHRTGRHPEYPHYSVHFAMEYLAHHEAHHIYQMYQRRSPLASLPD